MFKYFGSKHRLAATYQPPKHKFIVEPFAGAAAYAMHWLTERPSTYAILVEKDLDVYGLWVRLLDMTPDEILAIPDPQAGERTTDLAVALSASAASPLGSFKTTGDAQVTAWQARDWPVLKRRIAATRAAIGDRVTVLLGDYTEAPDIEATWHIDPPYQHQGDRYHHGSDEIDFEHLARWARSRKGQTMVCEARPADWMPFTTHKSHQSQQDTFGVELVWYSQPDLTLFEEHE